MRDETKCPRCGAEAVTPIPYHDYSETPSVLREVIREWACGSWEDENGTHHPVNTCGITERDQQIDALIAERDAGRKLVMEFLEHTKERIAPENCSTCYDLARRLKMWSKGEKESEHGVDLMLKISQLTAERDRLVSAAQANHDLHMFTVGKWEAGYAQQEARIEALEKENDRLRAAASASQKREAT